MRNEFDAGASLVIGGSGGIGAAIARRIASAGSDVAITYRHGEDRAKQTATSIRALGVSCTIHQVDIGVKEQINSAIAGAISSHERLHSVVVAAGSDIKQPLLADVTDAQWDEVIAGDLTGFFSIVKGIIPHFRAHKGGSLVHISSVGFGRITPQGLLFWELNVGYQLLVKSLAKE